MGRNSKICERHESGLVSPDSHCSVAEKKESAPPSCSEGFFAQLLRKKPLERDILVTPLKRCLNSVDLTLLGIGHMLGAGIYVLTGTVVHSIAGPATILSYFLAGIACLLASLGYVEFGAKVPKAGSAYTYTYIVLGEFWAFFVGWNLILEHMIAVAAVARAWSGAIDALTDGAIKIHTMRLTGSPNIRLLSNYMDILALSIIVLMMLVILSGAKRTTAFNNLITGLNICVIIFICVVGFSAAQFNLWVDPATGGFMPFGFTGVLSGAATCFFAYIGFESIAVAGEEAKNPSKAIPVATFSALLLSTVMYTLMAAAFSLLIPWTDVDVQAPFQGAFHHIGIPWGKVIIAFGALLGLSAAMLGGMFCLPRAVYAMAVDKLFFHAFAKINQTTQTPMLAVVVFGSLTGLLAMVFDLETLVELLSIGTLICLTMVSICVIVVRYSPVDNCPFRLKVIEDGIDAMEEVDTLNMTETAKDTLRKLIEEQVQTKLKQRPGDIGKLKPWFQKIPLLQMLEFEPGVAPFYSTIVLVVSLFGFNLVLLHGWMAEVDLQNVPPVIKESQFYLPAVVLLVMFGTIAGFALLTLAMHEQNVSMDGFQTPLVPFLPTLSIFINFAMVFSLNKYTWVRLGIWAAIGLVVYFFYGMKNSLQNNSNTKSYKKLPCSCDEDYVVWPDGRGNCYNDSDEKGRRTSTIEKRENENNSSAQSTPERRNNGGGHITTDKRKSYDNR